MAVAVQALQVAVVVELLMAAVAQLLMVFLLVEAEVLVGTLLAAAVVALSMRVLMVEILLVAQEAQELPRQLQDRRLPIVVAVAEWGKTLAAQADQAVAVQVGQAQAVLLVGLIQAVAVALRVVQVAQA
jgi:hypothetical protein